jgi:V/A-type H+-transporting ATPase subunit I
MTRVTLCGLAREKRHVLEALQELGAAHLEPLREPGPLEEPRSGRARQAYAALNYLRETPGKRRQRSRGDDFDVEAFTHLVIANKERLRTIDDRRAFLAQRIATLEPWGDFTLPPLDAVAGQRLWFYVLPVKHRRSLELLALPWQIVHQEPARLFVAVISPDEPPVDLLPVQRSHVGARSLTALREELDDLELVREEVEAERVALTRDLRLLAANLAAAENRSLLDQALSMTADRETLFAVQGWVPDDRLGEIEAVAHRFELAMLAAPPGPGDQPPTLLEGEGAAEGGVDLVNFYQTPAYRSWNPALVVFGSFALFFAMILADAGYALLLAAATGLFWRRLGAAPVGRRLRPLIVAILACSLAYGVMVGSYFGTSPPAGSWRAALHVLDLNDFAAMMQLSLVIGVGHIAIGNLALAWLHRHERSVFVPLGWIVAMAGGLVLGLGSLGSLGGYLLLATGLAGVLFGATARGLVGLLELTKVTRLFGDILSYLRLFALGLASASLALTFNDLAADINAVLPGIGLLFAALVLVLGHAVTLALGIMSGVVHGLRLNFIEFFGWTLTDEGYPFKAFAKKELAV